MTPEAQRAEVVRYWWSQAEESLSSAWRETAAGAYTFAVNRLYYTAFYGVSAALLERQRSFRKHSGVRAAFHRDFIRTGLLDVEWGRFYDRLFEDRQEGDYIALVSFDQDYIAAQLVRCAAFLENLRPLIASLLQE
jgi:uncharacterized protein (UPF0332 family)